jgi:hypothetical protein
MNPSLELYRELMAAVAAVGHKDRERAVVVAACLPEYKERETDALRIGLSAVRTGLVNKFNLEPGELREMRKTLRSAIPHQYFK